MAESDNAPTEDEDGPNNLFLTVGKVRYRNPFLAASSPATESPEQWERWYKWGIGGIIVKTVTDESAKGTKNIGKSTNNQRALVSDSTMTLWNQGSTAKEMPSLDIVIDQMEEFLSKGQDRALIPSLASKSIYNTFSLYIDENETKSLVAEIDGILKRKGGINSILDNTELILMLSRTGDYKEFLKKGIDLDRIENVIGSKKWYEFIKTQLYGMADIKIWDDMFAKIAAMRDSLRNKASPENKITTDINIEVNFRYYTRLLNQLFMLKPDEYNFTDFANRIANLPNMEKAGSKAKQGNEYFNRAFEAEIGGRNELGITTSDYTRRTKSALHRTLFTLEMLAEKYDLGLIGKFAYNSDLIEMCKTCDTANYSGVTLLNTIKSPAPSKDYNTDSYPYIYSSKQMQVSGYQLKELTRSTVTKIRGALPTLTILASGGIATDLQKQDGNKNAIRRMNLVELEDLFGSGEAVNRAVEDIAEDLEIPAEEVKENLNYRAIEEQEFWAAKSPEEYIQYEAIHAGLQRHLNRAKALDSLIDLIQIGADGIQFGSAALGANGIQRVGNLINDFKDWLQREAILFAGYVKIQAHALNDSNHLTDSDKALIKLLKPRRAVYQEMAKHPVLEQSVRDIMRFYQNPDSKIDYQSMVEIDGVVKSNKLWDSKATRMYFSKFLEAMKGIRVKAGFIDEKNDYGAARAVVNQNDCARYVDEKLKNCGGECYTTEYCTDAIKGVKKPDKTGKETVQPIIDIESCTGCNFCAVNCPYDAIDMVRLTEIRPLQANSR